MKEIRSLSLGLLALLLTGCLCSCGSSNAIQSLKQETLYERVMRTGKIRCAYANYPPLCVKDPNTGEFSGVGVDALRAIAKKLGLTVELQEEVGWGNVVEGIQTGRYDVMVTTVWTNPNRAKRAAFSKPAFFSPLFAYARPNDNRFNGHPERINASDVTISTVDGETAAVIADADFPKAKKLSMPQMTDIAQNFLNVSTGKADIAIAEPDFAARYLRKNPGALQNVSGTIPVRIFPNCWMFKRGEDEFKAMLDTVLDEVINSGEMDTIIKKYESGPGTIYRVAVPYRVAK